MTESLEFSVLEGKWFCRLRDHEGPTGYGNSQHEAYEDFMKTAAITHEGKLKPFVIAVYKNCDCCKFLGDYVAMVDGEQQKDDAVRGYGETGQEAVEDLQMKMGV